MELRILNLEENRTDKLFAKAECQQLLDIYSDFYPQIGFQLPWVGYFVIHENEVVGACGFNGPPQDGKIEISYWTFEAFEGQGIASFSCQELINIAQKADPKIIITAKTAPEQNASTKILQKNGFTFVEVVQDHEIGDAWLWQLSQEK